MKGTREELQVYMRFAMKAGMATYRYRGLIGPVVIVVANSVGLAIGTWIGKRIPLPSETALNEAMRRR